MGNRGYITVFLTLLISVMLILVVAVLSWVEFSSARGRTASAMRSAMSNVRAEYDRYLFDNYHVLFLDQNPGGEGMGALEAKAESVLQENLGDEFTVRSCILTGLTCVMDDYCAEFRRQIGEAAKYLAAEKGVSYLMEKVEDDTPLTAEDMNGLNMEKDKGARKQKGDQDPRKSIRACELVGVAYWILPEDVSFRDYKINYTELPSQGKKGLALKEVDTGFRNMSRLKQGMTEAGGWLKGMEAEAEGILYAANCFNCLTDRVQEDTVLDLEMEYLISGKKTDDENYKSVINQILVIRTGCNFAYILTDADKMARLSGLAASLTWYFPPAQPVVKYLLAGAWSYIEAVADAYRLVRGKKVPYAKTRQNWLTDLNGLEHLAEVTENSSDDDDEKGLDYEDYLLILLAPRMGVAYYRMLDVMQLNVNQNVESEAEKFYLKDAISAFGMRAEVEYEGKTIQVLEESGY